MGLINDHCQNVHDILMVMAKYSHTSLKVISNENNSDFSMVEENINKINDNSGSSSSTPLRVIQIKL